MTQRKLTSEEKLERKRRLMGDKAAEYQIGTYTNKFVAPVFQRMIRAEAAAVPWAFASAVVDGELRMVFRQVGECVCVTCGKVGPWKGNSIGGGTIETGHFVAGRRASILFEPTNAHPQCKHCNRHLFGNQARYEVWMAHTYGLDEPDRLRRLKSETRQFSREELVDMRIEFQARLTAAENLIAENS